ncbi:DUF2786 domain-containing protein [Streptomyces sp. NPDC021224]|uniref:DUF2786 domain-containing protein n=1 Tax=unclassified Streptomyces TaxID=2593676 RepID=UPI0037A1893F
MSNQSIPESLLSRVRALLAKAEDPAATEAEAESYTAKATELMAKYGIEQALLADAQPGTDKPADRIITVAAPWAREKQSFVAGIVEALRGRAVMKTGPAGYRVHMFGFESDLERAELLYTSLLLQMTNQLVHVQVPYYDEPRAYRRSWVLGFRVEVVARLRAAEQRASERATTEGVHPGPAGRSTEIVLADRAAIIERRVNDEYGKLKGRRTTYRGTGFAAGQAAGSRANIGQPGLAGSRRAIGGAR